MTVLLDSFVVLESELDRDFLDREPGSDGRDAKQAKIDGKGHGPRERLFRRESKAASCACTFETSEDRTQPNELSGIAGTVRNRPVQVVLEDLCRQHSSARGRFPNREGWDSRSRTC